MATPVGAVLRDEPPEEEARALYRAATLSVALQTSPMWGLLRRLPGAVQPMALSDAIAWMRSPPKDRAAAAYQRRAVDLGIAFLATASARSEEAKARFLPILKDLLPGDGLAARPGLEELINIANRTGGAGVSLDDFSRASYRLPKLEVELEHPTGTCTETQGLLRAPGGPLLILKPALPDRGEVDGETLTTLVRTTAHTSMLQLEDLQKFLDPQSWSRSPFWRQCYRAVRREGQFVREPVVPLGNPWTGYCFEDVVWEWNEWTLASFQNYLDIDFQVDKARERVELRFSLYSCEGSTLLARLSRSGVDVDHGRIIAEYLPTMSPGGTGTAGMPRKIFRVMAEKYIRFSDLTDRRTPFQGMPGTGLAIVYMAPTVVLLWMQDLLGSLRSLERDLYQSQKGGGPDAP